MRINITVELTEDFRNFLITYGQRAGWLIAAGVLSAVLVGFMLVFPGAGATVVCLLLVGLFGYGLRVIYAPATFPNTERATLYSKLDMMLRENTELRRDIDIKHAENEHNAAVFRMAMDTKDQEYQAALAAVNVAADKILSAAPYAMDAAENQINPTKVKPKRVRKPTPSQARKLREAGKDG